VDISCIDVSFGRGNQDLGEFGVWFRMSDHGYWPTRQAQVMPPLDARVQAFWPGDRPLPNNPASPSALHGWSAKLAPLHEWETKALSLPPACDVRILLPCNFEKQLDKARISSCLGEADNSRFLYAFSRPLAKKG
jgi:hypothetical protein